MRCLDLLAAARGPAAPRSAGRAYILLWARTFRTLAGHLKGRPERALALFTDELYPFLRGDRLAARAEESRPTARGRHVQLLLAGGLPDEYVCGLLEGIVAVSGCDAVARATGMPGSGRFEVDVHIPPAQRLARAVQAVSTLRLPLLAAALLAGLVGAAAGITQPAPGEWRLLLERFPYGAWWRAPAAVLAVLAVQGAANAWHDLASPRPGGPIAPWRPARIWLWGQVACGYGFAAIVGAALVPGSPWVLVFVPAGLAASLLYHKVRDHGLGPLLVAVTHGPLIALGVLVAVQRDPSASAWMLTLLASLPVGAFAAAVRTLDDLADRPLDEAGGKRTLAVRLAAPQNAWLYTGLLVLGVAAVTAAAALHTSTQGVARVATLLTIAAGLAGAAAMLANRVRRHLDDPAGLAAARIGTIALHVTAAAIAVAAAAGAA